VCSHQVFDTCSSELLQELKAAWLEVLTNIFELIMQKTRVATNLENLEYSCFCEHGKLREFSGNSVQPQGKIVTNRVFLVCHSNICVK